MPSTMVDCLEVSKMRIVTSLCRRWLSVVLGFALMYILYVSMNSFQPRIREEGENVDIQVIRYSSKTTCKYGCNMAEVSINRNTSTADFVTVVKPAPRTSRWSQPVRCRSDLNKEDDVEIRFKVYKLDFKNRKRIKAGGYYKPRGCEPRSKVAIIVPYRDRETNLLVFLYNIHPFLVKQMLQYRIFVIEQSGHEKFNKGRLFNAAFDLVARFGTFDCLVFHDVNLLPLHAKTSYSCQVVPTQMSTSVVRHNRTHPHESNFGGVTSIIPEHFRAVNGYSNLYWGSVGADVTNMFWRLRAARIPVKRYDKLMGLYTMLPDPTEKENTTRQKETFTGGINRGFKIDGLANSNYKTISIGLRSLYTHIVVDINPDKDLIE